MSVILTGESLSRPAELRHSAPDVPEEVIGRGNELHAPERHHDAEQGEENDPSESATPPTKRDLSVQVERICEPRQ